ncbi:M23 family metallopeptidase [Anaerolinea thermophila]|uniref:M23 family metallopeptidase n=2 Tax=Anaerolinea TaxID=233189 RepID=UPI0026F307A6|nr:M23 family metallopeptidase [Anaerolinea thermophila]
MIHKMTGSVSSLPETPEKENPSRLGFTYWLSWILAVLMVAWLGYVVLLKVGVVEAARTSADRQMDLAKVLPAGSQSEAALPDLTFRQPVSVSRVTELDTLVPSRPRTEPQKYVVQAGDSVFSIAKQFNLKPETVLWANYNLLNDNPNMLSIGQELIIPAVDGVLYEPKPGETIEEVARKFKATPEDIISWPANRIDVADPKLVAGKPVMIPNGQREMRSWVVPTIWRANSGANKTVNAACDTSGVNVYGTGYFMWPADNHSISGNTFWSGHLGIDIAAAQGAPIYAADSGVVVYSGPIGGGYGLMVMIDHGNGFHTLYAHNSQLLVRCGQGVSKGQVIAYAGSTGNSTGPHLHFEIRYLGAFVNPLDYLQ